MKTTSLEMMKAINKQSHLRSIKLRIVFTILFFNTFLSFAFQQSKPDIINFWLGYTICSFREINPSDASAAVKIYAETFKERISKRYQKPAVIASTIFETLNQVEEAIKNKKMDLVSLTTDEYFKLKKRYNIYPFLAVSTTEDVHEKYVLIVRRDLHVTKLNELSGKCLSIPNLNYNPMLEEWLFNYLSKNNLPEAKKLFSNIKTFDKESNAVYDVFFRKSDCAVVRAKVYEMLTELNPQLNKSLTIFITSVPLVLNFAAVNADSDQTLLNLILDEIKNFHLAASGKSILNIFKAKKYIRIYEKDLQSAKIILEENAAYKKVKSSKKS